MPSPALIPPMAPVASPQSHPLLPLPLTPPALSHGLPAFPLPPPFPSRLCTSPCKVTALPGWSAAEAVHQAVLGIVAAAAPEGVPRAQVCT